MYRRDVPVHSVHSVSSFSQSTLVYQWSSGLQVKARGLRGVLREEEDMCW